MKKQSRNTILIALIVAGFLMFLHMLGWLRPVRLATDQVLSPIIRVVDGWGDSVVDGVRLLGSVGQLSRDNKDLQNQVAELKQQLANVKEISFENDQLRQQLGFSSRQNFNLSSARVIGYEPDNVRKFITIDKGSGAGLKKGMAVISSGVLVGTIDQLNQYSAQIFLASDPDFRIRAIGQDNRAQGTVKGQIGQGYVMDMIAQNEVIKVGETIITAGSEIVPKGLVIGRVESVERSDNAIFQTANIQPSINLNRLEIVFVVMGTN